MIQAAIMLSSLEDSPIIHWL